MPIPFDLIEKGVYFLADIYKQAFEKYQRVLLSIEDETRTNDGAALMPCSDCEGTGRFQLPDDIMDCVACKGTGKLWFSLF